MTKGLISALCFAQREAPEGPELGFAPVQPVDPTAHEQCLVAVSDRAPDVLTLGLFGRQTPGYEGVSLSLIQAINEHPRVAKDSSR